MIGNWSQASRTFDVPCTIEIERTPSSLHAHVTLDGDLEIHPGDRVLVHNAPGTIPFGDAVTLRSTATVTRATALGRIWTRMIAPLELTELYDVSFSDRRRL